VPPQQWPLVDQDQFENPLANVAMFNNGDVQAMPPSNNKLAAVLLALLGMAAMPRMAPDEALAGPAPAAQPDARPEKIPAEQFAHLLTLIKPQPGELRFHEIPWLIDVWEARKQAAAEGKPILVWSGAGGSPLGVC